MGRLGVTLGLVGLLATTPVNAQNRPVKSAVQAQVQGDREFLDLYKDISWLEEIVWKNAKRKTTGSGVIGFLGDGSEVVWDPIPENVGDVIEKTFYERVDSLVSRYSLKISQYSKFFTFDGQIIVSVPFASDGWKSSRFQNWLIINQYSLIFSSREDGKGDEFWPYKKYVSYPISNGFSVQKFPEFTRGLIPVFENGSFEEIYQKLRSHESQHKRFLALGYGMGHTMNDFHEIQAINIGEMLAGILNIEKGLENFYVAGAKAVGGRIVIEAVGSPINSRNFLRRISLSMGRNSVKMFYYDSTVTGDPKQSQFSYDTLKINFPILPK